MRMQLVNDTYHGGYSHVGGAQDFKNETRYKYGTDEAKTEAQRR